MDNEDGKEVHDVRLAEVAKAEGISMVEGRRKLVGFSIGEVGAWISQFLNILICENRLDCNISCSQLFQRSSKTQSLTLGCRAKNP